MSGPLFARTRLQEAFDALRADLVHVDGPRISTMRNYRFAIVPYDPRDEFPLRQQVQRLASELVSNGWNVLTISLYDLLVRRIQALGPDAVARLVQLERSLGQASPDRALAYIRQKILDLVEGPDGIAADCIEIIGAHVADHPDRQDRTLVLIGRAGALYPFFRTSALLRHLDGHTHNVPVVLLYPGERHPDNGLSFMGRLTPDRDYRPRIYP
jgi:hypothetical protein